MAISLQLGRDGAEFVIVIELVDDRLDYKTKKAITTGGRVEMCVSNFRFMSNDVQHKK